MPSLTRSIALALLAGSLGAAHAALVNTPPSSPTFSCADGGGDAGGSIAWPNGVRFETPVLSYLDEALAPIDGTASNLDCSDGRFTEGVSERKSKKGQREFLKVTMKEVFLTTGVQPDAPPQGSHVEWSVSSVLREIVDEVEFWDTTWHIVADYLALDPATGALRGRSRNHLGIRVATEGAFQGLALASVGYDPLAGSITLVAPTQDLPATLSLLGAPAAVPEPGTLALLCAGFTGLVATAARRGRRVAARDVR